jgi:hypothetical protein
VAFFVYPAAKSATNFHHSLGHRRITPPSTSDDLRPGNLDRRMLTADGYFAPLENGGGYTSRGGYRSCANSKTDRHLPNVEVAGSSPVSRRPVHQTSTLRLRRSKPPRASAVRILAPQPSYTVGKPRPKGGSAVGHTEYWLYAVTSVHRPVERLPRPARAEYESWDAS